MRSLKNLLNNKTSRWGIIRPLVMELLDEHGYGKGAAFKYLLLLQGSYSAGGVSCGRSLRSYILDKIQWILREENKEYYCKRTVKTLLSILLSMYYSPKYVEEKGWFDKGVMTSLDETSYVTAAAFALKICEMPDMNDWSDKRIHEYAEEHIDEGVLYAIDDL